MSLRQRIMVVLLAAAALWSVPVIAQAQDYDLSFTLPTAGKSGCMVCHADQNLGRVEGSTWVEDGLAPVRHAFENEELVGHGAGFRLS